MKTLNYLMGAASSAVSFFTFAYVSLLLFDYVSGYQSLES